ncbi:MAG: hypothetical protein HY876_01815 [Coriobacteriales bacterium]|nr:hypothetical protein [Coriobacteriales bacterium]
MSEEHGQQNNQQTIMIALVAVVVLLVAALGFMIFRTNQQNALPAPTGQAPAQTAPTGMGGQTGGQSATPAEPVDPSKATKVKAGTSPEEWVNEYYTACDKGDYKAAVSHLPADKQASTTPESLKEQLAGYGITGYKVLSAKTTGDQTTVDAEQTTKSFGTFVNTWTFQKDGQSWVVVSKAVTGMK